MTSLKEKIFKVDKTLDRQEQYSRRNCLLVHGVEEKNNEDTDQEIINIVKNDLGEEITIHDIDRTHRLGKRKLDNNVPRPIIVKFTRYNVRNRIFKTKKKLEGKTVSITESLTKRKVVELKKVREMHVFKNVWSQGGKILFSDVNDSLVKCCLTKGKDCVSFVLFIIFLFKFWGFCTALLLITKNIGNAPLILKSISECSFILFKHANVITLLIQIFSIYLSDKLLLQISVNYLCYKILTACSPFECVYFTKSIIGSYNE